MRCDFVLHRFSSADYCTIGLLHYVSPDDDGALHFRCFTLEDERRDVKVMGQTRIPAGTYEITLRPAGGMHTRYQKRFSFHQGMLWLQDVPNFEWIYIHPGNDHTHTDGCILVGNGVRENVTRNGFLSDSVPAYERIYKEMADALNQGERVYLTIKDIA